MTGGCSNNTDRIASLSAELTQRDARIDTLTDQVDSLKASLAQREGQVRTLQALGDKRMENLFRVDRIRLGRHTGGYREADSEPDEGIRVYLKCVDTHGDTIKAAGDVTVHLFDLAGDEPVRIGEYSFGVDEIEKRWYAGPLTYHYRFDCPWGEGGPPLRNDVTVRVIFVDYLTGKKFSVQKNVSATLGGGR